MSGKPREAPPSDDFKIRCRKLGQLIHYGYCRRENQELPCARTLDCWHPFFDVVSHLRGALTPEEWSAAFESTPKPKVFSLLDLIEQAKKNVKKV